MSLSLYMLLTPPVDSEPAVPAGSSTDGDNHRCPGAILNRVHPGDSIGFARHQASRCLPATETKHSLTAVKLGFAASVVFNALGYLLMTSSLLLLLQIAQASLS